MLANKLLMEGKRKHLIKRLPKDACEHGCVHKRGFPLARNLMMFQLFLSTIYSLRDSFWSVRNLVKLLGGFLCINQSSDMFGVHRGEWSYLSSDKVTMCCDWQQKEVGGGGVVLLSPPIITENVNDTGRLQHTHAQIHCHARLHTFPIKSVAHVSHRLHDAN